MDPAASILSGRIVQPIPEVIFGTVTVTRTHSAKTTAVAFVDILLATGSLMTLAAIPNSAAVKKNTVAVGMKLTGSWRVIVKASGDTQQHHRCQHRVIGRQLHVVGMTAAS